MLLLPLAALGCGEQEIHRDQVPHESGALADAAPEDGARPGPALPPGHPPIGAAGQADTGQQAGAAAAAPFRYTAPDGWKALRVAPRGMRVAAFEIVQGDSRAEVTVIPLAGAAGSPLENVNRWRGQLGLPPLTDDQLDASLRQIDVADTTARYVDILPDDSGAGQQRILAAWLTRDARTWFFKMMGPRELVGRQKAAFEEFLHSLAFPEAGSSADEGGRDG